MNIKSNGRVNIITPNINTLFSMKDKIAAKNVDYRDAMVGNWYNTSLSDVFFSKENLQILQNGIRAGVYKRSNEQYIVDDQDVNQLQTIMRSTFLQHSNNQSTKIKEQISVLNSLVLDYAIGQVYGEAVGYMNYLHDASTMYQPISRPVMSKTNDKQLILQPRF